MTDLEKRIEVIEEKLGLNAKQETETDHKVPFDASNPCHIVQVRGGYDPHNCQADGNGDCYICGIPSC